MEKNWGDTPSVTLKVLQKIYSKFCIYCFFINTFYQKVLTKQNSVDIISGNCVSKLEISYYKVPDFEAVFLKFSLYKPIHPIKDLVQYLNRRKVIISSKWLKPSEKHYFTIEKKCLGIVRSILKFHRIFLEKSLS